MVNNGTVVTEETREEHDQAAHPDVCGDLGVPCLNLMEYIEAQGWTF